MRGGGWDESMYEVYIDVIFLVNLLPEYIILSMVARVLKYRTGRIRIIAGSAVAIVVTCVLLVLPGVSYMLRLLFAHIVGRTLILWLVFRIRRIPVLIKAAILVYGFTFMMGGFLEWICQTPFFMGEKRINIPIFLALTGTTYIFGITIHQLWEYLYLQKKNICRVRLSYCSHVIEVNGLLDTGNLLKEPIGGKPVSILGLSYATELNYRGVEENFRAIPYYSVGNPGGILHGFTADEMQIETEDGTFVIRNPMIGVCETEVSEKGKYGLIINPKLINH